MKAIWIFILFTQTSCFGFSKEFQGFVDNLKGNRYCTLVCIAKKERIEHVLASGIRVPSLDESKNALNSELATWMEGCLNACN